jgi:hypothetical protein
MKAPGIYKENGYIVHRFSNGETWSIIPNPMFDDIKDFDQKPDGLLKSQEQIDEEYRVMMLNFIENAKFEIFDFGKDK